jgi:tetrahydromethanopterin S-methyltransferase subunit G
MPTLIDTQHAFDRLRSEGGFSDEQANAIVDLFRDADEQVATRSDIDRLNERIDEVESRLNQRIELSEERLGKKIEQGRSSTVSAVAAVGAVLAVVIPLSIYLFG